MISPIPSSPITRRSRRAPRSSWSGRASRLKTWRSPHESADEDVRRADRGEGHRGDLQVVRGHGPIGQIALRDEAVHEPDHVDKGRREGDHRPVLRAPWPPQDEADPTCGGTGAEHQKKDCAKGDARREQVVVEDEVGIPARADSAKCHGLQVHQAGRTEKRITRAEHRQRQDEDSPDHRRVFYDRSCILLTLTSAS